MVTVVPLASPVTFSYHAYLAYYERMAGVIENVGMVITETMLRR
ncbi:MAG: hypothetical protein ACLFS8_03930 [Clostridia bacterium]